MGTIEDFEKMAIEVDKPKSKHACKPKAERIARREDVLNEIEENGPYSVEVKTLAVKWNVTPLIIYRDIDFLIKKMDIKKVDRISKKMFKTVQQNIKHAEYVRNNGSLGESLKACDVINKSADQFTKMMEQYGIKSKIADKLDVNSQGITFNLIEKSVKEIKDAKPNNQSETEGNPESTG